MSYVDQSSDGGVTLSGAAQHLGVPASALQVCFRRLEALGLVHGQYLVDGRSRHYLRQQSHAWPWVGELLALADDT